MRQPSHPADDERDLLLGAYADFNARRLEAVIARMDPAVEWPNGMEGGYVFAHEGVREYWTRQWSLVDPRVEPLTIVVDGKGRLVVEVRQVVKDRSGSVLVDTIVHHAYQIRDGRIQRMDIEHPS